MFNMQ